MNTPDKNKLDKIVHDARIADEKRMQGYRQRALKLFPWICGRCSREFSRENIRELTVHHRDHNHENNPSDGSNWELLCLYCHDNEHQRTVDNGGDSIHAQRPAATHNPFTDLPELLKNEEAPKTPGAGEKPNGA